MPFSLEDQLLLLGPHLFEELCGQLVKQDFPEACHVEGAEGDKGVDIFAGELNREARIQKGSHLHVWQVKFFRHGMRSSQREQAKHSLNRVIDTLHPDFWTLCIPVNLDINGNKWFESLKAQYPDINMDIWQADEIIRRLRQDESLINSYFLKPQEEISERPLKRIRRREHLTVKIKVFICYAREDENSAKRLFHDLKEAGLDPWLDKECLLPGQEWEPAIRKAIRESRYFLALLSSKSVRKRGFVQKEIREGLKTLQEFPESNIFLIPIRLDDCRPEYQRLSELHWLDMFPDWEVGLERILNTIDADRDNQEADEKWNTHTYPAWAIMEKELGNTDRARELFQKAVDSDPKHAPSWQAWAVLEKELGNIDEARMLFQKAAEADQKHAPVWQAWAIMEMELGNTDRARELFQKAVDSDPKYAPSWQAWALLEKELGNTDRARELFQKAVDSDTRHSSNFR